MGNKKKSYTVWLSSVLGTQGVEPTIFPTPARCMILSVFTLDINPCLSTLNFPSHTQALLDFIWAYFINLGIIGAFLPLFLSFVLLTSLPSILYFQAFYLLEIPVIHPGKTGYPLSQQ